MLRHRQAGGILGLWQLTHEHLELLEADFVQYYNMDLVTELEARPVRAVGLVRQLPPGSRLLRNYTGGMSWGWPEELLATVAELSHTQARLLMVGFGGKKGAKAAKKMKEFRVLRPWEELAKPRKVQSAREMVSVLGPILGKGSYG